MILRYKKMKKAASVFAFAFLLGWSPGAFSSDAGITLVLSPAPFTYLEQDSSYLIQVLVHNFGTDTLSFVPLCFTIGFTVEEDTFTGLILPDSGVVFTFSSTITITDTLFVGEARTKLPDSVDTNPFNDSYVVLYNRPSAVANTSGALQNATLYPNPASNRFTFEFNSSVYEEVELLILDPLGREVYRKKQNLQPGINKIQMEITGSPGLYTVATFHGEESVYRRLLFLGHFKNR